MEKGPSTYAEYWTSPENEVNHFKHAKEFGFDKITDYSDAAKNFAKKQDDNLMIFKRSDGAICKFDPLSKEFIATSKEGKIITYYKSSLRYFINQYNKKGKEKIQGDW